jgi:hypothetical protein
MNTLLYSVLIPFCYFLLFDAVHKICFTDTITTYPSKVFLFQVIMCHFSTFSSTIYTQVFGMFSILKISLYGLRRHLPLATSTDIAPVILPSCLVTLTIFYRYKIIMRLRLHSFLLLSSSTFTVEISEYSKDLSQIS